MAIRKGASFRDLPPHEKSVGSKLFAAQLDLELERQRAKELESLVRDLYDALDAAEYQLYYEFDTTGIDYADVYNPTLHGFRERMRGLGIETEGGA